MLAEVLVEGFDIETFFRDDGPVSLGDANNDGSFELAQELGRVIADVAEALHDDAFALERAFETGPFHVFGMAEEFLERVEHTPTRGLHTSLDTPLAHGFAGDARDRVDIVGVQGTVSVRDPGHLARARAHVRGGHVFARADVTLLDEFLREATGDAFELELVVFARVYVETPLGPAKGHVDDRAFVGHRARRALRHHPGRRWGRNGCHP